MLHIVRATLDANVAGVIDMYPSAWAAAAEMLAEALHGARLLTLEQVRGAFVCASHVQGKEEERTGLLSV